MSRTLTILLTAFLIIFPTRYSLANTLEFVRIEGLAEQIAGEKVIYEVYKRLGISIVIHAMPARRALYESRHDGKDGEMLRIWSYGDTNRALIRIPIPIAYIETQAFSRSDFVFEPDKKADYEYAIVRGVQHTLDATMNFDRVVEFTESSAMMSFVRSKRADIALSSKLDGRYQLTLLSAEDIIPVGDVWVRHALYHYIHERHQELIPKVTQMLAYMSRTGDIERLWNEAVEELNLLEVPID
ncbi:hypothetical protein P7F88_09915 [Vibrio hannami]|uniref:hypothetical protein n=1 Tax=Vibrio hannami TaxID=2717094 RepID=UPI00240FCB9E|nr:hypothetical protein [Vibrio hannami]MDG3086408.1 hypothetical protein [Vibrio hannami]